MKSKLKKVCNKDQQDSDAGEVHLHEDGPTLINPNTITYVALNSLLSKLVLVRGSYQHKAH